MDEKVKNEEPKVLLTEGEDGKMKAIAGEGADGKIKTVNPTKENADSFLKIDTRSNALENFFKKFSAQFNHPSHTGIYAVSVNAVDKIPTALPDFQLVSNTSNLVLNWVCLPSIVIRA